MTGEPARLRLLDFAGHEGAAIHSFFSYASGSEQSIGADLGVLADLVARGRPRPPVAKTVDWRNAGRALAALGSGEISGKAVLTIGDSAGASSWPA